MEFRYYDTYVRAALVRQMVSVFIRKRRFRWHFIFLSKTVFRCNHRDFFGRVDPGRHSRVYGIRESLRKLRISPGRLGQPRLMTPSTVLRRPVIVIIVVALAGGVGAWRWRAGNHKVRFSTAVVKRGDLVAT